MGLYKVRKRYEDAIEQGRSILRLMCMSDSFEAEVHLEIAICFDFLGRPDEAEAERQEAAECLESGPEDYFGWLARGKLFDKLNRYEEAATAYERALELSLTDDTASRENLLICMVHATFAAGRPDETLRWAEAAIAQCTSETRLYNAHRMAGIAAANLGRLEEAEQYRLRAYNMALEGGDAKKISDSLALLAHLHCLRGDLDKAETLCLKAESLGPDSTRMVLLTFAGVLRARGQIAEALEGLEEACHCGVMASSYSERRMQAAFRLWMAIYKLELGRLAEASSDLREAEDELLAVPKLGRVCEAARVRVLAHQGARDEAVQRAESLLGRLDEREINSSTRLECLDLLGRALFEIGDYERAERFWYHFLSRTSPPIAEPTGHYFLGECRWNRGDPIGARDHFQLATAPGIDSLHARLSEQRLRDLGLDRDGPS